MTPDPKIFFHFFCPICPVKNDIYYDMIESIADIAYYPEFEEMATLKGFDIKYIDLATKPDGER